MERKTIEVDKGVYRALEQVRENNELDSLNEAIRHGLGMDMDPDLDDVGSPPS